MNRTNKPRGVTSEWRMRIIGIGLLLIGGLLLMRLFHIQVINHKLYASQAQQNHIKKFEIPAARGEIYAHQKNGVTPLVLNETRYILYGDPEFVSDVSETSKKLSEVTGGETKEYSDLLHKNNRYVVLERNLGRNVKQKIETLKLDGIGFQARSHRVYPEGATGSQLLGFLNTENEGQYGIEQYYDDVLSGENGLLNTEVDARGVPIATASNTFVQPQPGNDLLVTLDKNIQVQSRVVAQKFKDELSAQSVSILVLDPNSGAVRAMNTFPDFHPGEYQKVEDYQDFLNPVVSEAYEPGSIFKVFTMSAGLEEKAVTPQETYYDDGSVVVNSFTIRNAESYRPQERTMVDVIRHSLNTGSVHVLKQLSNDNNITKRGKETIYKYFTDTFRFNKLTQVDLPQESQGSVEKPDVRSDVGYANMTFGQGLSATMLQMASAVSSIANGGTYYQPYVIDSVISDGEVIKKTEPVKLSENVLSKRTANNITHMMEEVVEEGSGWRARRDGYRIAGKTGTAQIASKDGGYQQGKYIGSMVGFAPASNPQYVLMVRVVEPQIYGYAGSDAAGQIFAEMNNWLLDYYMISPDKKK